MQAWGACCLYAFVHIEKTAGRTVRAALRHSLGARHCDIRTPYARRVDESRDQRAPITADDVRRVRWIYRGLRGIAGHNVKPYTDLRQACHDVRFFTFLREPVARYVSHYRNRARSYTREDFDRWADASWTHDWQTRMIAGEPNLQRAIDLLGECFRFVGFTETFDESMLQLQQWLGEPAFRPEYQSVNRLADKQRERDKARARTDLSYLEAPAVAARLQECNALDLQLYAFAWQEFQARQRADYRGDPAADIAALRERNRALAEWREPLSGNLLRNGPYKIARLLRVV
jgi:hypothetical protein